MFHLKKSLFGILSRWVKNIKLCYSKAGAIKINEPQEESTPLDQQGNKSLSIPILVHF